MRILFAGTTPPPNELVAALASQLPHADTVTAATAEEFVDLLSSDVFDALVVDESLYFNPSVSRAIRESATVSLVLLRSIVAPEIEPTDDFVLIADTDPDADEIALRVSHAVRRQLELERMLQRNEIATQAVQDIVYRLDDGGRFTYLNSAISQLGYDENELIGKHFTALLDEQTAAQTSRERVLPAFAGVATDESPKLFDERRRGSRRTRELAVMLKPSQRQPDGPILGYVTASGDVVTHTDGSTVVVGTIGVIRNASRLEESVDLLRKLYTVADSSQVGIVVTDRSMHVQYANPSFYRMSELNPGDVLGHAVRDIAAEGFDVSLQEELTQACSVETVVDREYSVLGYDGSPVNRVITGRPVYDAERSCGGVVLVVHPSGIRDDLNLPESAAAIVDRSVTAYRRESGATAEVTVRVADSGVTLAAQPASLLFAAVRDLLILTSLITDSGEVTIDAESVNRALRIRLFGTKASPDVERTASVSGRMQAAVARSDSLRAQLRDLGGDWTVNRQENSIEFVLTIPVTPAPERNEEPMYDLSPFVRNYQENTAVLQEILRLFREEAPLRISTIEEGLARDDFKTVAEAAHSLANTCGTLQSDGGTLAARQLETAARGSDPDGCNQALAALSREVQAILSAIDEFERSSDSQN